MCLRYASLEVLKQSEEHLAQIEKSFKVQKVAPISSDDGWHLVRAAVCGAGGSLDQGRVRGRDYTYPRFPRNEKDGSLNHKNLWFCHSGNKAFRQGDWKISYNGAKPPKFLQGIETEKKTDPKWELYNLKTDRCEMNDLALKYPDKVNELANQFEATAQNFREGLKIKS